MILIPLRGISKNFTGVSAHAEHPPFKLALRQFLEPSSVRFDDPSLLRFHRHAGLRRILAVVMRRYEALQKARVSYTHATAVLRNALAFACEVAAIVKRATCQNHFIKSESVLRDLRGSACRRSANSFLYRMPVGDRRAHEFYLSHLVRVRARVQAPGRCVWKRFAARSSEELRLLFVPCEHMLCAFDRCPGAVYQHDLRERAQLQRLFQIFVQAGRGSYRDQRVQVPSS